MLPLIISLSRNVDKIERNTEKSAIWLNALLTFSRGSTTMDAIRFFSDTSFGKHEIDSFMTRKKKGL